MKILGVLAVSLFFSPPLFAQMGNSATGTRGSGGGGSGASGVASNVDSGNAASNSGLLSTPAGEVPAAAPATTPAATSATGIFRNDTNTSDLLNPGDASPLAPGDRLPDTFNTAPRVAPAGGLPQGGAGTTSGTQTGTVGGVVPDVGTGNVSNGFDGTATPAGTGSIPAANDRGAMPNGTDGSRR